MKKYMNSSFFKKIAVRGSSLALAVVFVVGLIPFRSHADVGDLLEYNWERIQDWWTMENAPLGGWNMVDAADALFGSNKEQKYYTEPTESKEDEYGNVINYYRGGDTTSTKIIDSYNKTFNTIHNTYNSSTNTNYDFRANVKLQDFLNSYTTNNNNYSYSTELKSWYYDNDNYEFTYSPKTTYYNTENKNYYVSIDNSTDEFYTVNVQYSPTFVTVNYTYNNINNYDIDIDNSTHNYHYGDVTNVYYYELEDGRNSSALTTGEALGIAYGYDVVNYSMVPENDDLLSLQHFDGTYDDSSAFGREFYSVNRSTTYVDAGDFGQALKLPNGSEAGVKIPELAGLDTWMIEYRTYTTQIDDLWVKMGANNNFTNRHVQYRPGELEPGATLYYSDHDDIVTVTSTQKVSVGATLSRSAVTSYTPSEKFGSSSDVTWDANYIPASNVLAVGFSSNGDLVQGSYSGSSSLTRTVHYVVEQVLQGSTSPYQYSVRVVNEGTPAGDGKYNSAGWYFNQLKTYAGTLGISRSQVADRWSSWRIAYKDGALHYFLDGDFVKKVSYDLADHDGTVFFKASTASDRVVIVDELRVSTGDMVSLDPYTPSSSPFDSNLVLGLPEELVDKTIYVANSTPITNHRIGGVRPSAPTQGYFYVPLHSDYTGAQPQLYDGNNWIEVDAVVHENGKTSNVLGYQFAPPGALNDVNPDLTPEGSDPVKPPVDDTCIHDWQEQGRTEATCTAAGKIDYTCSKCQSTKSTPIKALGHTWVNSGDVPPVTGEDGSVTIQGYTLYTCSVCNAEYKDYDGTGPPVEEGGGWFSELLQKIADFLGGTVIGGLFEAIGTFLSNVLDGIIGLVEKAFAQLAKIGDLFGSFGQSVGVLWSWLPPEIVSVFVAGVTIVIFAAVMKLFLR